ncbi:MAG TPA: LuxR family transcriptional regulator [Roseiarcus sp.]|nr:LuxR family transcriptional regulator [Roseiarcus sp.]
MPESGIEGINIDRSAIRLTDTILGYGEQDLSETLKAIASEIGVRHIAHLRFAAHNSGDASLSTAIATYSRGWQTQYFLRDYVYADPVVARGRSALIPFDWEAVASDDPTVLAFLAEAAKHGVGRNGFSIPVRNGQGVRSLVSFTSDHSKTEWARYKRTNMAKLQRLSSLIDSAADVKSKLPLPSVTLSKGEQQCLVWAAKGKTYQEIAQIMNLGFGSVNALLDTARNKLHCMNLSHAIAVAIATGVIPPTALL